MSSVSKTEAGFIQETQSKADHSDAHSALFYLFQEVSKLASPNHPGFLDSNPSSKGLNDTAKRNIFKNERDEEDENSHQESCSCLEDSSVIENDDQHILPCVFPYNNVSNLDEPRDLNSPWKVLNLINLHCERILHQKDVKEINSAFMSSTKSCHLMKAAADVHETVQRNGADGTSQPSLPVSGRGQTAQDLDLNCSGHRHKLQECSVHVQIEKTCPFTSKLQVDSSAVPSVHKYLEWDQEHTEEDPVKNDLHQTQNSDAYPNAQMTFGSDSVCTDLSKTAMTLDHNANITLPTVLHPSQPEPHMFIPADSCWSLSEQNDKFTAFKPECSQTPTEEKNPDQQNSSNCEVSSASSPSELWMVQTEEINLPPAHRCRPKTQRKQPHPSRSADIQDPDFQGVTFRIDAELDDTREQCRLLITSRYSKELCKSVRKPKLRTRPSQKSFKTSSSEEETDLTANATKDKVCASCCTRKTPMWRDAEDGTPLCNACGIRYKKYRVRCVKCWHIPRKEGNSNSCCLKCGNFVRLTSTQRKHTT